MPESKKEKTAHTSAESKESKEAPRFRGIYRSETNKIIAGVAGGLGEYFNIDPTIIRILFVLITIFGGSGLIIYIILWLIIPSESDLPKTSQDAIRSNLEDMKSTTQTFAHSIRNTGKNNDNSKFWWAIIIIVIGFFFLMSNYGLLEPLDLEKLWPLALVIFGLAILLRK